MVDKFASSIVRECPELEFEDLRSDLWVVALETLKRWKPGRDKGKFSTYFFQKLVWKSMDIKEKCISRGRLERSSLSFTQFATEDYEAVGDPEEDRTWFSHNHNIEVVIPAVERSLDTLCGLVSSRLGEDEKLLFNLMVHPSPGLLEVISKKRARRTKERICYFHYSMYLGWGRGKVDSAIKKIKSVVEEVIDG